jgi:hypothetical protein
MIASPSGQLTTNGKIYDRLYYEFLSAEFNEPPDGFMVKAASLTQFLQDDLPAKLGLSQRETTDLIDDVQESLKKSGSKGPYYKISLISRNEIDRLLPQIISPKPDVWARNILYIKSLGQPIKLNEPHIVPIQRHGFTVIENGVVVK